MDIAIKLEKDDIITQKLGRNYRINSGIFSIIFSKEAAEEFIKDFGKIVRNDEIEFITSKLVFNQTIIYKGNVYSFVEYKDGDVWISPGPHNNIKEADPYKFPVSAEDLYLSK